MQDGCLKCATTQSIFFSFPVRLYQRHVKNMHKNSLNELMNGPIRKKLKIIPDCVKWGGTFLSSSVDLMNILLPSTVLKSKGGNFLVVSSHIKFSLSFILRSGLTLTNENVMGKSVIADMVLVLLLVSVFSQADEFMSGRWSPTSQHLIFVLTALLKEFLSVFLCQKDGIMNCCMVWRREEKNKGKAKRTDASTLYMCNRS